MGYYMKKVYKSYINLGVTDYRIKFDYQISFIEKILKIGLFFENIWYNNIRKLNLLFSYFVLFIGNKNRVLAHPIVYNSSCFKQLVSLFHIVKNSSYPLRRGYYFFVIFSISNTTNVRSAIKNNPLWNNNIKTSLLMISPPF